MAVTRRAQQARTKGSNRARGLSAPAVQLERLAGDRLLHEREGEQVGQRHVHRLALAEVALRGEVEVARLHPRALARLRGDLHPPGVRGRRQSTSGAGGAFQAAELFRSEPTESSEGRRRSAGADKRTHLSMNSLLNFFVSLRDMSALIPPHDLWPMIMMCLTCQWER